MKRSPPTLPARASRCIGTGAVVFMLAHTLQARAGESDLPEGLRVNGFATLGVSSLDTSRDWTFSRDLTQPGQSGSRPQWRTDSRVGMQINWRASPELELVTQGVLKKAGSNTSDGEKIELAFAAYNLTPQTQLRVGRSNPDIFLLADYRNVGFAYPWVRPSHDFYGWMPLGSINGAELTHHWSTDSANWRVRSMLGRTRVTMGEFDSSPVVDSPLFASLTVSRESGGLTLKASYAKSRLDVSTLPGTEPLDAALASAENLPIPSVAAEAAALRKAGNLHHNELSYLALGLLYDTNPWLVHAEVSRLSGTPTAATGLRSYLSLGYRQGSMTYFAMTGRSRPSTPAAEAPLGWAGTLAPVVGPELAGQLTAAGVGMSQVINAIRFSQRSYSTGLRWDIDTRMSLKLQWDRFFIDANGAALWGQKDGGDNRASLWSATLDMVF